MFRQSGNQLTQSRHTVHLDELTVRDLTGHLFRLSLTTCLFPAGEFALRDGLAPILKNAERMTEARHNSDVRLADGTEGFARMLSPPSITTSRSPHVNDGRITGSDVLHAYAQTRALRWVFLSVGLLKMSYSPFHGSPRCFQGAQRSPPELP